MRASWKRKKTKTFSSMGVPLDQITLVTILRMKDLRLGSLFQLLVELNMAVGLGFFFRLDFNRNQIVIHVWKVFAQVWVTASMA